MSMREFVDDAWGVVDENTWAGRTRQLLATPDVTTWWALCLSGVLFVGFALYTTALYRSFWMTGADFGSYVHMFSTTLSGQGWLLQGKFVPSHPAGSYWGGHFSLTLLLFFPAYALFPSPYTLLVAKSFVLAASVPALWLVVREHVDDDRLGLLVVVSYALNPFLWSAWVFDFQEQSLLPVFVFLMYYSYCKAYYKRFFVLLALSLLTNEFAVLPIGGFLFGLLVAAARKGQLRHSARVLVPAIGVAVAVKLLAGVVIAHFSVFSGIPVGSLSEALQPFVTGDRVSLPHLAMTLLSHPEVVGQTLATHWVVKLVFLLAFLLPVVYLGVFEEASVFGLTPFLAFAWLLTDTSYYYRFEAHYPLYVLPILFIGAIRVLDRYEPELPRLSRGTILRIAMAIVLVNGVFAANALEHKQAVPNVGDREHERLLQRAIDTVPDEATLVTQNTIYSHVATRQNSKFVVGSSSFRRFQRLYGTVRPEYVLYDTRLDVRPVNWAGSVQEAFFGRLGDEYGVYRHEDGIWLFKRGYTGSVGTISLDGRTRTRHTQAEFLPGDGAERSDETIRGTNVEPDAPVWYGPYTTLPSGNYTATVLVNARRTGNETGDGPILRLDVAAGDGHRVIETRTVGETDGYERVPIEFTLDRTRRKVEFRGFSASANATVSMKWIEIETAR